MTAPPARIAPSATPAQAGAFGAQTRARRRGRSRAPRARPRRARCAPRASRRSTARRRPVDRARAGRARVARRRGTQLGQRRRRRRAAGTGWSSHLGHRALTRVKATPRFDTCQDVRRGDDRALGRDPRRASSTPPGARVREHGTGARLGQGDRRRRRRLAPARLLPLRATAPGLLLAMARHRDEASGFAGRAAGRADARAGRRRSRRCCARGAPTCPRSLPGRPRARGRARSPATRAARRGSDRMGELHEAFGSRSSASPTPAASPRAGPSDAAADWAWARVQPATWAHLVERARLEPGRLHRAHRRRAARSAGRPGARPDRLAWRIRGAEARTQPRLLGHRARRATRRSRSSARPRRQGFDSVWVAESYGSDVVSRARLAGPADRDDQARRRDHAGARPPARGRGDGRRDDRRALRRPLHLRLRPLGPAGLGGLVRGRRTRSPGAGRASTSRSSARSSPARARSSTTASTTSCRSRARHHRPGQGAEAQLPPGPQRDPGLRRRDRPQVGRDGGRDLRRLDPDLLQRRRLRGDLGRAPRGRLREGRPLARRPRDLALAAGRDRRRPR